jgi:hypothetical protein
VLWTGPPPASELAIRAGVVLADADAGLASAMSAEAGVLSPAFSLGDSGAVGAVGTLPMPAAESPSGVVGSSGKELGSGTGSVGVGAEAPNAAPGGGAVTDTAAVAAAPVCSVGAPAAAAAAAAGAGGGAATAAAPMIVGAGTCVATEPTGGGAGASGETVPASSALTEALSDLRADVAGGGSPGAALSVPGVIGSPVVLLALGPGGSVNVGIGDLAAVASVASAAAPGCGLGVKRVCALEPSVDP